MAHHKKHKVEVQESEQEFDWTEVDLSETLVFQSLEHDEYIADEKALKKLYKMLYPNGEVDEEDLGHVEFVDFDDEDFVESDGMMHIPTGEVPYGEEGSLVRYTEYEDEVA